MLQHLINELEYMLHGSTPAVGRLLLFTAVVMFATWAIAYILIIQKCFREKTYGVPIIAVCLNISWEAQMALAPPEYYPWLLKAGNHLWLIPDLFLLFQLYRFGRANQRHESVQRHYYVALTGTLALSFALVLTFRRYFNDDIGVAAAFLLAFIMSIRFIFMALERPDGSGLSYRAGWLMMIGNIAAAIFCYFWWPMQFAIGRIDVSLEPTTYWFLYVLFLTVPIFNLIYILQVRQIRARQGAAATA